MLSEILDFIKPHYCSEAQVSVFSGCLGVRLTHKTSIGVCGLRFVPRVGCSADVIVLTPTQFEWENKVAVSTPIKDLRAYLQHLQSATNMLCLTPEAALSGECDFLSANLSARSVFGEDALANVSLEKGEDGAIAGHVRIRSKTQGIALSLGDKVSVIWLETFA